MWDQWVCLLGLRNTGVGILPGNLTLRDWDFTDAGPGEEADVA